MIDCREIQILDSSFDLTNTVDQNTELKKENKLLIYLGLSALILLIGMGIYLMKEEKNKKLDRQLS